MHLICYEKEQLHTWFNGFGGVTLFCGIAVMLKNGLEVMFGIPPAGGIIPDWFPGGPNTPF